MELKRGYKQTEVGVIPEEWHIKNLGALIERGRLGGNYPSSERESSYPLIKMGNLARGYIDLGKIEYVDRSVEINSDDRLFHGDILFNTRNTLDLVGKVAIWRDELPAAYYNSNLMRLDFKKSEISSNAYANYAFNSKRVISALRAIATGTTSVAAIYTRDLLQLPFIVPPKNEQVAISSALTDIDALISSLNRLIEKKRDIKQATMQQLLTGKQRLPGFSEEWVVKRLGEVAHIKTGSRNNEDKDEDGPYPFFVRSEVVERIDSYSHDCEAILVPGEGRIGSIFHYIHGRFDVHQRVYAVTQFKPQISGRFIYFYLSKYFGAWAMQNTVKATVDSLRLPTFLTFVMRLPVTLDEQTAIASVLSDMDAEIAALELKRDKTLALKQGMMQELLTGRIRLI